MKGGGGVSWNALMGTEYGGVTIHMVDIGIDTGDILIQWKYDFPLSPTSLEQYANLVESENAKAIKIFLDRVINRLSFERTPQNIDSGSYWPRLKTEIHGYINWNWSAEEIHRFIVAFGRPYSGAKTFISSNEYNINKSSFIGDEKSYHPFQYGIVYRVVSNDLYVAAKNGSLIIHDISRSDGEKVNPKKLIGYRFITPMEKLSQAMSERVIFKPNKNGF
jgi:methionyl-tRNA formyltransferase